MTNEELLACAEAQLALVEQQKDALEVEIDRLDQEVWALRRALAPWPWPTTSRVLMAKLWGDAMNQSFSKQLAFAAAVTKDYP